MFKMSSFSYNVLLVLIYTFIMNTAAFDRPCNDLSTECLTSTLQKAIPKFIQGVPELGLDTLDPYIIEKLHLTLPGGMNIEFRDGYCSGSRSCIVDFARLSGDTFEAQVHCNLTIKGKYKSSGRLLMFQIDGDGDSTIKCRNIKLYTNLKLGSKTKSDGQKYLMIKHADTRHSYDGRVSYMMTNLFKRNPEISAAVVDFMNENWRMVAEEFGDPLVEYGVALVMKNIRKLFDTVPMKDFFNARFNL